MASDFISAPRFILSSLFVVTRLRQYKNGPGSKLAPGLTGAAGCWAVAVPSDIISFGWPTSKPTIFFKWEINRSSSSCFWKRNPRDVGTNNKQILLNLQQTQQNQALQWKAIPVLTIGEIRAFYCKFWLARNIDCTSLIHFQLSRCAIVAKNSNVIG